MKKNTFMEEYSVKFSYKKEDGFWKQSAIEDVFVEVEHGVNEKNNHLKARKIIEKKYPGCKIISVSYI